MRFYAVRRCGDFPEVPDHIVGEVVGQPTWDEAGSVVPIGMEVGVDVELLEIADLESDEIGRLMLVAWEAKDDSAMLLADSMDHALSEAEDILLVAERDSRPGHE